MNSRAGSLAHADPAEGGAAADRASTVNDTLAAVAAELEQRLKQRRIRRRVLAMAGLDPWNVAVVEHAMETGRLTLSGLYRVIFHLESEGLPRHLVDQELSVRGNVRKADKPEIHSRYAEVLADWQLNTCDSAAVRVIDARQTTAEVPAAGVMLVPDDVCPTVGERVCVIDPDYPSRRQHGVVERHVDGRAEIRFDRSRRTRGAGQERTPKRPTTGLPVT